MAKRKLVIELEFDEEADEFDSEHTFLEFAAMRVVEDATTVTEGERGDLAEAWSQSDWYSVGFVSALP